MQIFLSPRTIADIDRDIERSMLSKKVATLQSDYAHPHWASSLGAVISEFLPAIVQTLIALAPISPTKPTLAQFVDGLYELYGPHTRTETVSDDLGAVDLTD